MGGKERRERRQREGRMSSQVSSELIWQAIKGGNAFSVRSQNNIWFSKEKGNLYGKHSYKYSGVANARTIDVDATGSHLHAAVTTTDGFSKKPNTGKRTVVKQDFRGMSKAVLKTAKESRKDLTGDSLRKLAAIHKSRRVIKAT